MIKIQHLTKTFGNVVALKDIDLSVQSGEFFGLLGPNGAGKTTTVNILSTMLKPDVGSVTLNGFNLLAEPIRAKNLMGVVPQELALYDRLTAVENLRFWGKFYGITGTLLHDRMTYLLDMMELTERSNHHLSTFSGGMKRRVNLAVALLHDPKVLFLDEPTVGIDVQSRHRIYDILTRLHNEGKTIIYTTHYLEEVERLCDRIAIIDHGEIKADGSLEELQQLMPGDREVYLKLDEASLRSSAGSDPLPLGVALSEDGLTGRGDDVNTLLQTLVTICSTRGWSIRDIELKTASLETVFLQLTGRALRD